MQSLLQAVKANFKEWPDQEYFTCDPDGEVRGYPTVEDDFYPEIEVYESDRGEGFGFGCDGTIVTKEMFESN